MHGYSNEARVIIAAVAWKAETFQLQEKLLHVGNYVPIRGFPEEWNNIYIVLFCFILFSPRLMEKRGENNILARYERLTDCDSNRWLRHASP